MAFRYVAYRKLSRTGNLPKANGSRIISMSLFGKDPRYLYGAIRNAQLAPVIYPGWTIRFYIADGNSLEFLMVPQRILLNLKALGAQLSYVSGDDELYIKPRYWRYLVADDEKVTEFIIRNVDARLTDRDKSAVDEWLKSTETLHTMRDHPKYENIAIPEGLWGARRRPLSTKLGLPMRQLLLKAGDIDNSVILSSVQSSHFCHSSNTCINNSSSIQCKPFHLNKKRTKTLYGLEYIGQRFNQYMIPMIVNEKFSTKTVKEICYKDG